MCRFFGWLIVFLSLSGEAFFVGASASDVDEPMLTVRWGRAKKYRYNIDQELLRQIGVNQFWYVPFDLSEEKCVQEIAALQAGGFPVQVRWAPELTEETHRELASLHPTWRLERFEITEPVLANSEVLEISLAEWAAKQEEPGIYSFDTQPKRLWRVVDQTDRQTIPQEDWTVEEEVVRIKSKEGHLYSVIFLPGSSRGEVDLTLSDIRAQVMAPIDESLATGARRLRAIVVAYVSHLGARPAYDWYSYIATTSIANIDEFERSTGKTFDPMWFFPKGFRYTADDPPVQGYLDWMTYIRKRIESLARDCTDKVHQSEGDRFTRFFWGDGWIGIEPYCGALERAGYDEIAMPANEASDVRRVMDFDDPAERIIRLWKHTDDDSAEFSKVWKKLKRAALLKFPDGLTLADKALEIPLMENDAVRADIQGLCQEFRTYHDLINGEEAYEDLLNLYVINAWGHIRAWPRAPFSVNPSQQIMEALTDLPVRIQFISLRDIEQSGIPADADVILNAGEPGSSWSGGEAWSDEAAEKIRGFVDEGGGFFGVDAPAVKGDQCLLEDVLGLDYLWPASETARMGLFNPRDPARRFKDLSGRDLEDRQSLSLDSNVPMFQDLSKFPASNIDLNVGFGLNGAACLGGDCSDGMAPMVSVNQFGEGQAVYLSGYASDNPVFDELVKRLLYLASGRESVFAALDCPTPGGYVYYYPEKKLLIVYNEEAEGNSLLVRASVLQQHAGTLKLNPVLGVEEDVVSINSDQLAQGVRFNVPQGEAGVFHIVESGE